MANSRRSSLCVLFALAALLDAPSPARAQSSQAGKWEVDVHGGGLWSSNPTAGTANPLPVGEAFSTVIVGRPSRRESSWFFGDGATLLNSVNTALRANGQITPLDGALGAAAVTRGAGAGAGARIARRFGARYAAEFSFDYAATPLEFTGKTVDGIEASRGTFVNAFRGLFATGPFSINSVTATADLTKSAGHQLLSTGVLTVDLLTHGRFVPAVAGGARGRHQPGRAGRHAERQLQRRDSGYVPDQRDGQGDRARRAPQPRHRRRVRRRRALRAVTALGHPRRRPGARRRRQGGHDGRREPQRGRSDTGNLHRIGDVAQRAVLEQFDHKPAVVAERSRDQRIEDVHRQRIGDPHERGGGRVLAILTEHQSARASEASEPRDRSEPAKRRARARVGESEWRSPSGN